MTDRVFQDAHSFEVEDCRGNVEFYVMDPSFAPAERGWELVVTVSEEGGWNSQKADFRMTREEATALIYFLIYFLISKGY
jgi:hypothetical protein